MTDESTPTTRRQLMRPAQLLSLAFGAALFAGVVTAVSTGVFQGKDVWVLSLVVAGVSFIAMLLGMSMLLLAIDPAQVTHTVDRPVLYPDDEPASDKTNTGKTNTEKPGASPQA